MRGWCREERERERGGEEDVRVHVGGGGCEGMV